MGVQSSPSERTAITFEQEKGRRLITIACPETTSLQFSRVPV
jgi:hypothetical protein